MSDRPCARTIRKRLADGVSRLSLDITIGLCGNCRLLWASVWYKSVVHDMGIAEADRKLPCLAA